MCYWLEFILFLTIIQFFDTHPQKFYLNQRHAFTKRGCQLTYLAGESLQALLRLTSAVNVDG